MKRSVTLVLAVLASVLVPGNVDAAPPSAADLAADCNDDGRVDLSSTTRYVGGTGVLASTCIIALGPDVDLVLRGIELTGAGPLALNAGPSTTGKTVRVVDSVIDLNGFVELTPGANAGDAGVPDNDATVVVRRSKILAEGIQLATSLDWPNGRTIVRDSELTARGTGSVRIEASVFSTGGIARVVNSAISAAGVHVRTDVGGRTVVRDSAVAATNVTLVTGLTGLCRAVRNTPPLVCT